MTRASGAFFLLDANISQQKREAKYVSADRVEDSPSFQQCGLEWHTKNEVLLLIFVNMYMLD